MTPSFREILKLLNEHEIDYIVVGGVAAVIHGAPVTTFDPDALVRVEAENARKLMRALDSLDARYRNHHTDLRPTETDILSGGHMLLLTRAGPLDLLGPIGDGATYEDLIDATIEVETSANLFRPLTAAARELQCAVTVR